ncbi:iron ABC transporter permease [Brevibacillus sp. SYP-B805]|uniref:FecCD family ABC transporter permease n=1 Tax=Brevibacillus sp. SYP-B805 TaxID=1578199 RepID=UPI0013EE0F83|nr:iron ABC transporter permease [Brevibacillus sp. SYP-B805]NGQ96904.1 iron ABC transporter permease [Brevibacillus sp. SYP-B805]
MRPRRQSRRCRFLFLLLTGCGLLLVCAALSLRFGAVSVSWNQLIEQWRTGQGIVVEYRLPRLLAAMLVGMNMAVAGSVIQGVSRNPMAAPDLIGLNAGGGLAIAVLLLMIPDFPAYTLPVAAFCGAAAAGGLVFLLAYRKGGIAPVRLVLSGVAVGSGLQALITLLLVKYAPNAAQALVFLKGSLYARTWQHVEMIAPWALIGIPLAFFACRYLSILQLDEESIKGLGLRVNLVRLLLLVLVVALAGSAVAVAGTIGFVGLMVPHLVKYRIGPDFRFVIPLSALFGALLVVIADLLGRVIMPPAEIPAGIITALLGAPYFLYLLVMRK